MFKFWPLDLLGQGSLRGERIFCIAEEKQSKTCRTFGYLKYLKYPQGLGHEVFNPLITTIFPLDEGHKIV
jgi:hypothetical protein